MNIKWAPGEKTYVVKIEKWEVDESAIGMVRCLWHLEGEQ